MKFIIYHVSIIESIQRDWITTINPKYKTTNKLHIFESITRKLLDNYDKKEDYAIKLNCTPIKGKFSVVIGKYSRSKIVELHDDKFNPKPAIDYSPILWIWDRERQILLVEIKNNNKGKAFLTELFKDINAELPAEGYIAHFNNVLTDTSDFWKSYDSLQNVELVSFELIPPNAFGHTDKETKETLQSINKDTNADKITMEFENTNGDIKLQKISFIDGFIRWCKNGAGKWLMKDKSGVIIKSESEGENENTNEKVAILDKQTYDDIFKEENIHEDTINQLRNFYELDYKTNNNMENKQHEDI